MISLLNRTMRTQLTLCDVMHAPDIGYTLISVSKLDEIGHGVKFGDGSCRVSVPSSRIIGIIKKSVCGLYCVTGGENLPDADDEDSVAVVVPKLSVMELHQ